MFYLKNIKIQHFLQNTFLLISQFIYVLCKEPKLTSYQSAVKKTEQTKIPQKSRKFLVQEIFNIDITIVQPVLQNSVVL